MNKEVIICVDDEVTVLRSLKAELQEALGNNYLIEIAQEAEEALELIKELLEEEYEVVLIISDQIMPGMKGDELLKQIHIILPKALKIMLTGQADLQAVENAIKYAKLYRYISKPWQSEDLSLTVKEAINSYLQDKEITLKNTKLEVLNQDLAKLNNELSELNHAFSRFVPRQFLQLLDKQSIVDIHLGDQVQQEMSVLFADIRDFTTLSESMTPEENFRFINSYLSRMEAVIIENHGFIDKYRGDGIMALFSSPADNAVNAGIAMLKTLKLYNQHRANCGYEPISSGIGINTGSVMLGTIGGHNRMDSTVIGDTVNLASRIEALTKSYQVPMLISHHTLARLDNPTDYSIRFVDRVKVKGKSNAVGVFEVFDAEEPEIKKNKLTTIPIFEEGLWLYNKHSLLAAEKRFNDVVKINPADKLALFYLDKLHNRLLPIRLA